MGNRLTSSHLVLGCGVRRGEATQSHLCNVMLHMLHRGHIHCESCRTNRKAGAGPGSGATQNGEPGQSFQFRELRLREARQVQELGLAERGRMAQQDGGRLQKESLARTQGRGPWSW